MFTVSLYMYWTTCLLSGEMCDCLLVYSLFNGRNGPMINIVNTGFCYFQCCCNRLSGYRAVWTHFKEEISVCILVKDEIILLISR